VYVVVGALDLDEDLTAGTTVVRNAGWAEGQATSVRAGIDAAASDGHDAVVIGLGDQPFVTATAWRDVAAADAPIAVASYDGQRGHPVRLHRSVWDQLPTSGDEVGRSLIRSRPDLVRPIPCAGDASDIDTVEDLERWT
jgi:molybdenum cofactor cytidylyltransferase